MINCFVYLDGQSCTINLAHITFIEWDIPNEDERGQVISRTTTISLSGGGGFFLSEQDSWTLRKAVQEYNKREQEITRDLHSLNGISDALFWLYRFKDRSIENKKNINQQSKNQGSKEVQATISNNKISSRV